MIVEPGMELRAFRLDGTSVTGIAVSGPTRKPRARGSREGTTPAREGSGSGGALRARRS